MPERPVTDLDRLVECKVDARIKPFIYANSAEHEETRRIVKENTKVLKKLGANRAHSTINSTIILLIMIGMLFFLTGC